MARPKFTFISNNITLYFYVMSYIVRQPNKKYMIFRQKPKLIKIINHFQKEYIQWEDDGYSGILISDETAIKILGELKDINEPIKI